MSRFTPNISHTFRFDGDEVAVTFRRMQNKHLLAISPALVPDPGSPAGVRLGVGRTATLVNAAEPTLRECVLSITGLNDSAGNPVAFDTVLAEAYFLPLLDEILGELLRASVLQEVDAKKSVALSPAAPSGGSASPTPSPVS